MGTFRLDRRSLLLSAAALGAIGLAGCNGFGPGSSSTNSGGSDRTTLVIGATAEPDSLDITTGTAAALPQVMLYNVLETLVRIDSEGSLRPLLATAWALSDDRLTYTFTLRSNATFSSGTDVTPDAVVKALELQRASATNARDLEAIEQVATGEGNTVVITLKAPSNFLLYNLAGRAGTIIDPDSFAQLATKPLGSGPYVFDTWTRGTSIALARNDNYWGNPPKFASVTFTYFKDPQALTNAMLTGDIDIISDLTAPESLTQFSDTSKFTIIEGTTNGEVVLGFNHRSTPLKDINVRQAINYAIDRRALLDTVWDGKGTLIGSMVAPTDPWYEDLSNTYPYDPAKAKELLKDAGPVSLRLRVPTLPYAPPSAQFIASALKQVGITVTVEELDFTTWIDSVYTKHDYDMTIVNHVEPRDIVNWANPDYYWGYNSAEFQTLITQADQASAEQEIDLLKQAARLLATDAVADFLFSFPHLAVCKSDLSGVQKNTTTLSFDVTTIASRNS